jgi:predicted esterase
LTVDYTKPPPPDGPAEVSRIGLGPLGWGVLAIFCNVALVPSLLAIVTALMTLGEMSGRPDGKKPRQAAIAGILLGVAMPLVVVALLGVSMWALVEESPDEDADLWEQEEEQVAPEPRVNTHIGDTLVDAERPADAVVEVPVAVFLHGKGATPYFGTWGGRDRLATSRGIILASISGTEPQLTGGYVWSEDPVPDLARIDEGLSDLATWATEERGRTVLFGFSQGAAVAMDLALAHPERFAGVVALSPGRLTERPAVEARAEHGTQHFLILVGAGEDADTHATSRAYADAARAVGAAVELKEAVGQSEHQFPDGWEQDLGGWLDQAASGRGGLPEQISELKLIVQEVSSLIQGYTAQGFLDADEMVELAVDMVEDRRPEVETMARAEVARCLSKHKEQEATWTEPTDNDRLDLAFRRLNQRKILAKQDFSDCGTCGAGEMQELVAQQLAAGKGTRGYTFFHQQDTEGAADGGGLYLGYGSAKDSEPQHVAIGQQVADELRKAGLVVTWDGTLESRVGVEIDWKKRRFTEAPAIPPVEPPHSP